MRKIEIIRDENRIPCVDIGAKLSKRYEVSISMSHSKSIAVAVAMAINKLSLNMTSLT